VVDSAIALKKEKDTDLESVRLLTSHNQGPSEGKKNKENRRGESKRGKKRGVKKMGNVARLGKLLGEGGELTHSKKPTAPKNWNLFSAINFQRRRGRQPRSVADRKKKNAYGGRREGIRQVPE